MLASVTNVQTGEVLTDALQAQVTSATQYAEMFNQYRGKEIAQDNNGNDYVLSDAHLIILKQKPDGTVEY
jgi:hypothetical protein